MQALGSVALNILDLIKKARQSIVELWERTEKKDRKRFFLIAGTALVVIVVSVLLLTKTNWVPLYSSLDAQSSSLVTAALGERGTPFQVADGGATILVPDNIKDQVSIDFAAQGIPSTGLTYDLFALGNGLTSSTYEKRIYENYQLQEHIKTSLKRIGSIQDALVLLAIPDNDHAIFQNEVQDTTASVVLTMRDGAVPTPELVQTVENLVVGAVPGMHPGNVKITDDNGALLQNRDDIYSSLQSNYAFQKQVESDLASSVYNLLKPLFGANRVRARVGATLNFDDHAIQSTTFSPVVDEDGIPISVNTINEQVKGYPSVAGEPGIDPNGGAPEYTEVEGTTASEYSKYTETINYEVNKVEEQIVKARGSIEHLTIAVTIDSTGLDQQTAAGADAVRALVGGATGLEKADYGLISVEFYPFLGAAEDQAILDQAASDMRRAELFELIKTLFLFAIIGVCIILLIVRTLSLFKKKPSEAELLALDKLGQAEAELDEYGELVKLATAGAQIEVTKSPVRERVEEFIDNNPDAVAQLLRNWINDEPSRY